MLEGIGAIFAVITVTIMAIIMVGNMLPALTSNDPEAIQRAADRTIEQIVNFTTDRIVDEVKSLPLQVLGDALLENK